MSRLLLCAYDVSDERRLAAALHAVTAWSHGGQRSAFECFPRRGETHDLARKVAAPLIARADRFGLFQPIRARSFAVGPGLIAADLPVLYLG